MNRKRLWSERIIAAVIISAAAIILIGVFCCVGAQVGRIDPIQMSDMKRQIETHGISVERVDSDHDINKPKERAWPANIEEADALYKTDRKFFLEWVVTKWPTLRSSLDICTRMAQEQIKTAEKKP